MQKRNKKILIVGNSAKEYALIKKLSEYEVFCAPGNSSIKEIAQCVDIREENVKELLEFVLENAIDFTIASSEIAIKSNIAGLFHANGQMIFAPSANSADIALSRSSAKKFLYRLKIPTPHFGIFEKAQLAIDYLKNAPMPQVIRSNKPSKGDRLVCTSFSNAKVFIEDLFTRGEDKIVLEDYIFGHEFTAYIVTDGYSSVLLNVSANYKLMEDGDGGILTPGVGSYSPDYKISNDIKNKLMQSINKVIETLANKETPYLGILGVECVLTDDNKLIFLDFKPFLADHDAQLVLSLVNEDILSIFESCAVGAFGDEYENLNISDKASVSCVISSRIEGEEVEGLDYIESDITPFVISKNKYLKYETIKGMNFVVTKTAKTLSMARNILYDDVNSISFNGKKYRTDICKQVENF